MLDLNSDCSAFFDQLLYAKLGPLNAKVMACIFWRLIKALASEKSSGNLLVSNSLFVWNSILSYWSCRKYSQYVVSYVPR